MLESESKSIIAMKGHPFTRKTEFADCIATSLECPVFYLHDFLDFLAPDQCHLAFGMLCELAKSNLSEGCVDHIVIDSPLSSRSHLDQLIQLAESADQTRLLIVECKSDNTYKWQTRFEEYSDQHPADVETPDKWYKARNWEDVEKAIRDGYDERSDGYKVSKLVVDPLSFPVDTLHPPGSHQLVYFMDVVKYMIKHNPELVVYDLWRRGHYVEATQKPGSCRAGSGHYITDYVEALGLDDVEDNCTACGNQLVMGAAAYKCKLCRFALHKECAEDLDFRRLETGVMPTVIRHDCHQHFLSVEMSDLNPCGGQSNCNGCGFIILESVCYSCKICGVVYHYKCLTEVPVGVPHVHGAHHHQMLIQYSSQEAEDYLCYVCFENGDPERRDPSCWFYSCQDCHFFAHLTCVSESLFSHLLQENLNHVDPTNKSTGTGEF